MSATPLAHAIARKIVFDQEETGRPAPACYRVSQAEYDALVEEMKTMRRKLARPVPTEIGEMKIMGVKIVVEGKR